MYELIFWTIAAVVLGVAGFLAAVVGFVMFVVTVSEAITVPGHKRVTDGLTSFIGFALFVFGTLASFAAGTHLASLVK